MISDPTGLHTLQVIARADNFNRWMYQTIQPYLEGEILEIGSGMGNISKYAVEDKLNITLSDYDTAYCKYLKDTFAPYPNVRDVLSIDLQDEHFFEHYRHLQNRYDTLFLLNVIEHLQDDGKAVRYCSYLLKKNGKIIILAPAYQRLFCNLDTGLGHHRRYTVKGLKGLLTAHHFSLLHAQYFNVLGMAGWLLFGKIGGQKALQQKEMSTYNRLVPLAKVMDAFFLKKFGLSAIAVAKKN